VLLLSQTFLPHVAPFLPIVLGPLTMVRRALSDSVALLTDAPPDYKALAAAGPGKAGSAGLSSQQHRGPYAALPRTTCPICYAKSASSPSAVPIPQLPSIPALPPAGRPAADALVGDDPHAIHIPVRANCWAGCFYCYFCLGEALVRTEEAERLGAAEGRKPMTDGWPCLRCGGSVRAMTMVEG
jgi:peroxin-2